MKIIFIRHGENTLDKRGGWSSEPLTDKGVAQIKHLTKKLRPLNIDYALSSDLIRTVETTAILRSFLNIRQVKYYPELREVNNGLLAGLDNTVANKEYPGIYWKTLGWKEHYPNGESPKEFYERINMFWNKVKRDLPTDSTALIISHQGVFEIIQNIEKKQTHSNKTLKYNINLGNSYEII